MSNISYICYIVEKNTNLVVDENVNMIMVYDRFDNWEYEQKLMEERRLKDGK